MAVKEEEYKLLVVGGGGVGKSAYTIRFTQNHYMSEYDPTIEDSYRKDMFVGETCCKLDILDTAGMEEYSAMRDQYFRSGQGFLMVFSMIDSNSLTELTTIAEQVLKVKGRDKVPMVVIGNKCDLASERTVGKEQGEKFAAQWGCQYFEGSAKDGINIEEPFRYLITQMQNERPDLVKKKKGKKTCIVS